MRGFLTFASMFALLLGSACAAPAPTAQPKPTVLMDETKAVGFEAHTLAEGKLDQLPDGPVFINFIQLPQAGGDVITHAHVAGMVYVMGGSHRMTLADGSSVDLYPGAAGFVAAGAQHSHLNPTTMDNDWLFVSVRPTGARSAPPAMATQKLLYATDDFTDMPKGPYVERLMLVTLQPGGRGAPHIHGGVETLYVLQGSVRLQLSGQTVPLEAGQGFSHPGSTPIQDFNAGTGEARVLAHFITPDGKPFRTDLDRAP